MIICGTVVTKTFMVLLNLIILVLAFIAPISIFIHAILGLALIDLITAVLRDMRKKKENKIAVLESRKIRKTVTKMLLYVLFIISSFLLMQVTFGGTYLVPNFVFGMLAMVEVVSIGENMASVTGNNVFIKITKKISKFFSNKIDKIFE